MVKPKRNRTRDREQSAARSIVIAAISPLKAALKDEYISFDDIGVGMSPIGTAAYRLCVIAKKPITITVMSQTPADFMVGTEVCRGVSEAMTAITALLPK